jgi:hypothetical protein
MMIWFSISKGMWGPEYYMDVALTGYVDELYIRTERRRNVKNKY